MTQKICTNFRRDHVFSFFWPVEKCLAQKPYRRKFVSIRHGGQRPRWWASGGIRGVNNNVGVVEVRWSQLRSRWHQERCMRWKSVYHTHGSLQRMWHEASHARCAIVVPSAMMCVQNYAGSRVKRGSCWKCYWGWHAICLRYSYNCVTTVQLTQSVARVSRRQLSLFLSKSGK